MKKFMDNSFIGESISFLRRNFENKDFTKLKPGLLFVKAITDSNIGLFGSKVLEVGCGAAKNLLWLYRQYKCECDGVEPDPEAVQMLCDRLPFTKFRVATADALPFNDEDPLCQ